MRAAFVLVIGACDAAPVAAGEPTVPSPDAPVAVALSVLSPTPAVVGGCSDILVQGLTEDDTMAIVAEIDAGLAAAAEDSGTVRTGSWALPHPAVAVTVLVGTELSWKQCQDVSFTGTVTHEAAAISGEVRATVDPNGTVGELTPRTTATVVLEDLVFEDAATGSRHTLPYLELPDAFVGWTAP